MATAQPSATVQPSATATVTGTAQSTATPGHPRFHPGDGTRHRPPRRRVIWRDDFTGPAGEPVDRRWWNHDVGGGGWGNKELQLYTGSTANSALDGAGHLVITARRYDGSAVCWYGPCRYTSARLTTEKKVTARSGRVEARMRVPVDRGLWPAFWLLGDDSRTVGWPACGELDVMELVGDEPGVIWSSVHGPGYVRAGLSGDYRLPPGETFADRFHTYAMDWTPSGVSFSVDGHTFHEVRRSDIGPGNTWVFDKPMHLLLNVAVGGEWPGTPPPQTRFPAHLVVDHVAIYE